MSALPLAALALLQGPTPEHFAAIALIVFVAFGIPFVVAPIARGLEKRLSGSAGRPLADDQRLRELEARLDRIERAAESIAVEVERIGEGQRFVNKLMAERDDPRRLDAGPTRER